MNANGIMPLRERIRAAVRRFLGLDDLATKGNIANLLKFQQAELKELRETLERIDGKVSLALPQRREPVRHVPRIPDWDMAQAEALASLEIDPRKEN